jgi:hypothetical protein
MWLVVDEHGVPADTCGASSIQYIIYGLFLLHSSMSNIVVVSVGVLCVRVCWSIFLLWSSVDLCVDANVNVL